MAERGLLERARVDIDVALANCDGQPAVELAAGLLLFVTHDYQHALDMLASAARHPTAARPAQQLAIRMCLALGWEHDARDWLERAIANEPGDRSWRAWALRFYQRGRCWLRARDHGRRALELAPSDASSAMELAHVHAALGERELSLAALASALRHAPAHQRTTYLRAAGRVATGVGAYERAEAWLSEALAREPDQPDLHVWLAELASWTDAHELARKHAESALELDPRFGPGHRMLGAIDLRRGEHASAQAHLREALELDPDDYQAHLWLAEMSLRSGALEVAGAAIHEAIARSPDYLAAAWMLRYLLIVAEGRVVEERVEYVRTEEFEDALVELAPSAAALALQTRAPGDFQRAVEAGLAALRGNRSVHATHVVGGRLVGLRARTGCRHRSRWALQLLRVAEPELALAELRAVAERHPRASLPPCHSGELHLWLGNWVEARAELERAVELVIGTRWAYMGLSTLELLADHPDGALETNARGVEVMRNTEEPAIHVFRGEALRKLGRLERAIDELERSVAAHPSRVSAVVNLALAYAARGDLERFEALWHRLIHEQACGLMSDAASELSRAAPLAARARFGPAASEPSRPRPTVVVGDGTWKPALDDQVAVLERALLMMGGNRSSGLSTYWTSTGQLRFVQQWPHKDRSPHSRDAQYIGRAKKLMVKALSLTKAEGVRPRDHRVQAPRVAFQRPASPSCLRPRARGRGSHSRSAG